MMADDLSCVRQYPVELVERRQWCLWRVEPDKKGHQIGRAHV